MVPAPTLATKLLAIGFVDILHVTTTAGDIDDDLVRQGSNSKFSEFRRQKTGLVPSILVEKPKPIQYDQYNH